ncbi:hypothetical protein Syun_018947 [Stephania yunnanensis]|uniref:Uncharacterized protein n=1 Tax=Stephania yunnanensis TaxID=152371 RepID=A0AAP0NXH4_9MAGN
MDSWCVWGGTGEPFSHRGKWSISFQNTFNHGKRASFLSQSVYLCGGIAKDFVIARVGGSLKSNSCSKSSSKSIRFEESNQELIMGEGGIGLLSMTDADAKIHKHFEWSFGAIANLCGNDVGADLFWALFSSLFGSDRSEGTL